MGDRVAGSVHDHLRRLAVDCRVADGDGGRPAATRWPGRGRSTSCVPSLRVQTATVMPSALVARSISSGMSPLPEMSRGGDHGPPSGWVDTSTWSSSVGPTCSTHATVALPAASTTTCESAGGRALVPSARVTAGATHVGAAPAGAAASPVATSASRTGVAPRRTTRFIASLPGPGGRTSRSSRGGPRHAS